MYMQEIDMDECDYDGRTALHVAAAEGHLHVVKFLLEIVGVQVKVELVVHSKNTLGLIILRLALLHLLEHWWLKFKVTNQKRTNEL